MLVLALASIATVKAQTRRVAAQATTATRTDAATSVVPLPASDAVLLVDMRRLLNEAMPRVLAGDAARLAQVNADIEQFKQRTGIDPRSFERIAVGVRFTNPSPQVTKLDHLVVIANGTFKADVLAMTGRIAAKGKYTEAKHGGKSVYTFNLNEQVKMFGLLRMRVGELAMSVIDANTLAIGEPAGVRAAIDASTGRGRVSPEIVALARRRPDAIVGFGANVPRSLLGKVEELGNEEISRSLASIRQLSGSLGATATGYDALLALRTATEADARGLNTVVDALRPLAAFGAAQMSGDKGRLVQKLLGSLQVTTEGNEVVLRLGFAQTDVAMMLDIF